MSRALSHRRAWLMTALAAPLVVALAAGFGRDPRAVPSVLVGQPAPTLALQDLDGHVVDLADLRGAPVLLNFWATWCYPCQAEHDLLQQTARSLAGRAHVLGVIYEDSPEAIRGYVREHGSAYRQLIDEHSRAAMDYGVAGVPESFIIDAQGQIVHKQAGVMTPDVLAQHLMPLLAGAKPGRPGAP